MAIAFQSVETHPIEKSLRALLGVLPATAVITEIR
jgi:hypothetical protein